MKPRAYIPRFSRNPRKVAARALYAKLCREYKRNHPVCEVCDKRATKDVHHTKGRGRYLNDQTTWLPVCRQCHEWIHNNPFSAREAGLLF